MKTKPNKKEEVLQAEIDFLKELYFTSPTLKPEEYSDSVTELECFQDGFDDACGQIQLKIKKRIKYLHTLLITK